MKTAINDNLVAKNPQRKTWWSKNWQILPIILLALLLRLPLLNGSFWLDEAAQALESVRPLALQTLIVDDFQPPLLHYILHFASRISIGEAWLRWWGALLPALLTILGTFLLAKKLFSRKIAFLTVILLSINAFHVFFSQEIRQYSLSAVWAIWSWVILLEALNVGTQAIVVPKNGFLDKLFKDLPFGRNLVFFIFLSLGGLYSSYLYPFVLLAQFIFLTIRKKWSFALPAGLIIFLGFLPWLPSFWEQLQAGTALRSAMPGWDNVVSFDQFKSVWMTFLKFIYGPLNLEPNLFFISTMFILIILGVIIFWKNIVDVWKYKKDELLIAFFTLCVPFLLAWIASFWVPVIQPKRVIFLLPIFLMLISVFIFGWQEHKHQWSFNWFKDKQNLPQILFLLILILINFIAIFKYWTDSSLQRENWRGLWQEIRRDYPQDKSVVLFAYVAPFSPWQWYENNFIESEKGQVYFPALSTGSYYLPAHNSVVEMEKLSRLGESYETVLLFDYLRDLTDPNRELDVFLQKQNYIWTKTIDYPSIGFVRVYTLQKPLFDINQGVDVIDVQMNNDERIWEDNYSPDIQIVLPLSTESVR